MGTCSKIAGSCTHTYQNNKRNNMKLYVYSLLVLMLIAGCTSSHSDPQPSTPEDLFLSKLRGTWTLTTGEVTVDGLDVTNAFTSMEVTFSSDSKFSVKNAVVPIWPSNGTFALKANGQSFDIVRSDDIILTVQTIDSGKLTISFNYDSSAGRKKAVSGKYVFEFKR
jgi:hypothetical protein